SKDAADERIYFDLGQPFTVPWFSQDPRGLIGLTVTLRDVRKTNIVRVFHPQLRAPPAAPATNPAAGSMLDLAVVDLRGLFYHKVTTQSVDRAGKVLQEVIGRIPNLGQIPYSETTIFATAATPIRRMRYRYEAGWRVERSDAR